MAAPTTVRVEAESMTTTRLRWVYAGSNTLSIYRSTDGASYSLVETVASSIDEYEDTGLAEATKYWYKLSDDNGSTYSSVVTVWTHSCEHGRGSQDAVLPLADDEVTPELFNELSESVQSKLTRFESPSGRVCTACIEDGALVINCLNYDGCEEIEVLTDQTVNSISLPECEDRDVDINFIIPPDTTVGICGWPRGIGFTGDECTRAPVRGGSEGRSINEWVNRALNKNQRSGRSRPGTSTQGTRGGGQSRTAGSCTCTPGSNGELTIKACTSAGGPNSSNSLNCSSATPGLRLIACGGRGPYTWSTGGSVNLSATTGGQIRVTPPTNSGSAVAGTAYKTYGKYKAGSAGSCITAYIEASFGCNDAEISCATNNCDPAETCTSGTDITSCTQLSCVTCTFEAAITCNGSGGSCATPCDSANTNCKICQSNCSSVARGNTVCDKRTAGMVSNGCNPCGTQAGTVITVTDATGASTTITLGA